MASSSPSDPPPRNDPRDGFGRITWSIDQWVRDRVGLQPDPRNPFISPITPLSEQLRQQLDQASNPPLPIPTTPPLWLADP